MELLAEHGFNLRDVISILDSQSSRYQDVIPKAASAKGIRKPRSTKVYKNPHNRELIETKGGNHKLLKEWKSKYGADEVEAWLV